MNFQNKIANNGRAGKTKLQHNAIITKLQG